jgi:hypothetical protein
VQTGNGKGNEGWVKLWRSSLENGWLRNHKLWVFWSYCLLKASHKEHKVIVGNQQVTLQPGQFIFGRKVAAQETGLSERNIRTNIDVLRNLQNMTIKTTNKFSVITIVNWGSYQQEPERMTNKTTKGRPAVDHIQECNNGKKNIYPFSFEDFWKKYPARNGRKVGKKSAMAQFQKLGPDDHGHLLQAVCNYSESKQARDGYAKDAERFLKNDFWRDWVEVAQTDAVDILGG